jgi:hypothetical protein
LFLAVTPIESLRYLQGYGLGDGWIHNKHDRFKVFVYDPAFACKVRDLVSRIKAEYNLTGWESKRADRLTGTLGWTFEIGRPLAVYNLNLGLAKAPEGPYFLAGLWDADGSWSEPDESHPLGQARIFGGWHVVYTVKHTLRHAWGILCGRMSTATAAGHTSKIGDYTIVTRTNVYGTCVKARSMANWIDLIGKKMLLKGRPELCADCVSTS